MLFTNPRCHNFDSLGSSSCPQRFLPHPSPEIFTSSLGRDAKSASRLADAFWVGETAPSLRLQISRSPSHSLSSFLFFPSLVFALLSKPRLALQARGVDHDFCSTRVKLQFLVYTWAVEYHNSGVFNKPSGLLSFGI